MATDGKITLVVPSGNTINVDIPVFGYETVINMPFDIQRLDDGTFDIYDNGAIYDKRECSLQMELSETEIVTFNTFFNSDLAANARGKMINVSMSSGSGFFPFGPDKGDVGTFLCPHEIEAHGAVGESPYLYFKPVLHLYSPTVYPAYVLPSEVNDGPVTIGTVTNLRFPPNWFSPEPIYGDYVTIEQRASSQYIDRTSGGDSYTTSMVLVCNESKAAAVLDYLTGTVRAANFTIVMPDNAYMWGGDKSASGTYTVKLIDNIIRVTHTQYNRFEILLSLSYVSGPA